jgi:hypothetical protein
VFFASKNLNQTFGLYIILKILTNGLSILYISQVISIDCFRMFFVTGGFFQIGGRCSVKFVDLPICSKQFFSWYLLKQSYQLFFWDVVSNSRRRIVSDLGGQHNTASRQLNTCTMDIKDENDEKLARLQAVFEQLWETDGDDEEELGDLDELTERVKEILKENKGNASSSKKLEDCFNTYDKKKKQDEDDKELVCLESFISTEQALGRQRRFEARKLEAIEEMRLAVEIAQLKGVRMRQQLATTHEEVQLKNAACNLQGCESFTTNYTTHAKRCSVANTGARSSSRRSLTVCVVQMLESYLSTSRSRTGCTRRRRQTSTRCTWRRPSRKRCIWSP